MDDRWDYQCSKKNMNVVNPGSVLVKKKSGYVNVSVRVWVTESKTQGELILLSGQVWLKLITTSHDVYDSKINMWS